MRSEDLIAQESPELRTEKELHARFGGDEFCFLIPDLDHFTDAFVIAERFREAVARYEWTSEDPRLTEKPVNVDVGVVCLLLGPVSERRALAPTLAQDLLERADKLMYEAKGERAVDIRSVLVRLDKGALTELEPHEHAE